MKWDDLRFYLAIARAPSLAAAGRQLGVNQSTVSRRLAAMEAQLGTRLFERGPGKSGTGGPVPTAAGEDLLAMAEAVEALFTRIDCQVGGRDTRLVGRLRVTCVDMMVHRYLAPHLARFSALNPGIELTLLSPYQPLNLGRREADVAIRVTADPPETLIGRRLLDFAMAAYVAPALLDRMPAAPDPTAPDPAAPDPAAPDPAAPDPAAIDWIGWESESYHRRIITTPYPRARTRHRVDSLLLAEALVREGLGASVLPCYWADSAPGLRRLYAAPTPDSGLGLWVLTHPDTRRTARVQAFTRFITQVFLADRALFEGRGGPPPAPAAAIPAQVKKLFR